MKMKAAVLRRFDAGQPFADSEPISIEEVTLDPPQGQLAFCQPLLLRFPVVRWSHGSAAELAYLPTLQIEVVAKDAEELSARLPQHALQAR